MRAIISTPEVSLERRAARPHREGDASDVQAEFLRRVRRASPSCALARVDEPTLLRDLRAPLPPQKFPRTTRARLRARLRRISSGPPCEARPAAPHNRARDAEPR